MLFATLNYHTYVMQYTTIIQTLLRFSNADQLHYMVNSICRTIFFFNLIEIIPYLVYHFYIE